MFKPGDVHVQKFGGSSVASPERILKIAERIAAQAQKGKRIVAVVSAMGDTTDNLIGIIRGLHSDPDPRELDQLVATGEMVSASLMAVALQKLGISAKSFNACNLKIITNDKFGSAEIQKFEKLPSLTGFLKPGRVAVIAGFQGITSDGDLTTLGRGGSDITAVAIANFLGQKVCEKFTDEDGVYSADPRFIPMARKVWHLNFEEMETLSLFGNGLLNYRSIEYAKKFNIRIHVRSSFSQKEGSIISPLGDPQVPLKSLTCDKKQAMVTITGKAPFKKTLVDYLSCVTPSKSSPSMAIFGYWPSLAGTFHPMGKELLFRDNNEWEFRVLFKIADSFEALPFLWELAEKLSAQEVLFNARIAVISIVGNGITPDSNILQHFIEVLREKNISPSFKEQGDIRFTVAVLEEQTDLALATLHDGLMKFLGSE